MMNLADGHPEATLKLLVLSMQLLVSYAALDHLQRHLHAPCLMLCQQTCLLPMCTNTACPAGSLLLHTCFLLERLHSAAGWAMWMLSSWQMACSTRLPTWAS